MVHACKGYIHRLVFTDFVDHTALTKVFRTFYKGIVTEVSELTIVNYKKLLFIIGHFHNNSTHLMKL